MNYKQLRQSGKERACHLTSARSGLLSKFCWCFSFQHWFIQKTWNGESAKNTHTAFLDGQMLTLWDSQNAMTSIYPTLTLRGKKLNQKTLHTQQLRKIRCVQKEVYVPQNFQNTWDTQSLHQRTKSRKSPAEKQPKYLQTSGHLPVLGQHFQSASQKCLIEIK